MKKVLRLALAGFVSLAAHGADQSTPTPPPKRISAALSTTPGPVSNKAFAERYKKVLEAQRYSATLTGKPKQGAGTLAGYQHHCRTVIGHRWQLLVNETSKETLAPGSVTVTFQVLPEGLPKEVKALEEPERQTGGSEALRKVTISAVEKSRFDPLPDDLRKELNGKPLEMRITFSLMGM